MITLIHGQDTESSYRRLSQILSKYQKHTKIYLDKNSTEEKIHEALFGQNLTGEEELIIIEDIIKPQSKILKILQKQTPSKEVILWEKQDLRNNLIEKLPKNIKVEYFKKSSPIFSFLDSLTPNSLKAASLISGQDHLLWHLENRILLLILAKIGLDSKKAGSFIGRPLQDWQFAKIKDQASKFEINRLMSFYNGALKIDYMIKTGKTKLDENILSSILLLKYLQK